MDEVALVTGIVDYQQLNQRKTCRPRSIGLLVKLLTEQNSHILMLLDPGVEFAVNLQLHFNLFSKRFGKFFENIKGAKK